MQSDGDNCSRRVQENGSSIREENKIAELSADDGEEAINSDNVDVQTALDKIFISSQTVDRPEGDNERRNVCKSPPSQQLAAAVRDVYLPVKFLINPVKYLFVIQWKAEKMWEG